MTSNTSKAVQFANVVHSLDKSVMDKSVADGYVQFKDLTMRVQALVRSNKILQTFPSGTYLQGFKKPILDTGQGYLQCRLRRDPTDAYLSFTTYRWVDLGEM